MQNETRSNWSVYSVSTTKVLLQLWHVSASFYEFLLSHVSVCKYATLLSLKIQNLPNWFFFETLFLNKKSVQIF